MARGVKTDIAMIAIILVAMAGWYFLPRPNRDGTPAVDHLLDQRMLSAWISRSYLGSQFPEVVYKDPTSSKVDTLDRGDNRIIIALSNEACNPCQIREMKFLDSLYQETGDKISVIGLYHNGRRFNLADDQEDREAVLRLRHVSPSWLSRILYR